MADERGEAGEAGGRCAEPRAASGGRGLCASVAEALPQLKYEARQGQGERQEGQE